MRLLVLVFRCLWLWMVFSVRRPLLASLVSVLAVSLLLGAVTYTQQGMAWVLTSPELQVTNPTTDEVLGVLRPVRIVAMSGRLLLDWLGELI